jgi:hypothetical protein
MKKGKWVYEPAIDIRKDKDKMTITLKNLNQISKLQFINLSKLKLNLKV